MSSVHWVFFAILSISAVIALDLETPALPRPPYHEKSKQKLIVDITKDDALFGYSIAYQRDIKSLIVGAPKEDQIGQVYQCPITPSLDKCKQVKIDRTTIQRNGYFEHEHKLWLGANVNAGKSFFMACAPRYTEKATGFVSTNGRCLYKNVLEDKNLNMRFMLKVEERDSKEYYINAYNAEPGKNNKEIWMDTFGLSSYIHEMDSPENNLIFVGGPAMSIGRVIYYKKFNGAPTLVSVKNKMFDKKTNRTVSHNFGYSITSGHFLDPDTTMYAISTPYGTIGYGRVYFFSGPEISAEALFVDSDELAYVGSMFGAALASLKRLDGRHSLLVGAPAYTPKDKSYDVGAVFVYKFVDNKAVLTKILQEDFLSGGYFGASIVCVGDLDGDLISEVAIGAPLDGGGKGAVYLYSGKDLLNDDEKKPVSFMQKLLPEDHHQEQYFGWSLTALADADENGCNELAVGAPGSNTVVLYSCIASVIVTFEVDFSNLKDQALKLQSSSTDFTFEPCFNVTYSDKPQPSKILTEVEFSIEVMHQTVTMKDATNRVKSFKEHIGQKKQYCEVVAINLPQDADYDEDVRFKLSVELIEKQNPLEQTTFNPYLVLLNQNTRHSETFTAPYLPGSELTLDVAPSFGNGYLIGSSETELLNISLANSGRTAFGVCLIVDIHGVNVKQIVPRPMCSFTRNNIKCKFNKQSKGENSMAYITLDTKALTSSQRQIEISTEVLTNNCKKLKKKKEINSYNLATDKNITITRYSTTNLLVTKEELHSNKGKRIEHIYEIINNGITRWTNVSCEILLPPQLVLEKIKTESYNLDCKVKDNKANCMIKRLSVQVKIIMKIDPASPFVDQILKGKATVDTRLRLFLNDVDNSQMTKSLTTILTLWEGPKVALWMIIVASLVGIFILVLLFWALHECGFMRRENKQKLEELKKDVKRQSVRRSMMLRQSTIEVMNKDQEKKGDTRCILDSVEEDAMSHDGDLGFTNAQHVKAIHHDDDDPARTAFQLELAKAFSKGNQKDYTEAEIH